MKIFKRAHNCKNCVHRRDEYHCTKNATSEDRNEYSICEFHELPSGLKTYPLSVSKGCHSCAIRETSSCEYLDHTDINLPREFTRKYYCDHYIQNKGLKDDNS